MKRNAFILSLTIVLLLIAGDIFPRPPDFGRGMGRGHGPMFHHDRPMCYGNIEKMKEVLKLSDDQIEQIGRINGEFSDTMRRLHEKMQPLQLKLRDLLLKDIENLNELRSLLMRIAEVEVDIRMTRIKHMIAIEKVLTKEQRDRLRQERRSVIQS